MRRFTKPFAAAGAFATRVATTARALPLLVLATAVLSISARAGQEVHVDGCLHIRNGGEPSRGRRVLDLEQVWSAGGPQDEETIFGLITRVRADQRGNICVLDAQLHQVHIYSPTGSLLASLFREGEGPGEIRMPRDMLLLHDGEVGVLQLPGGKLVKVDRDGNPTGTLSAACATGRVMLCSGSWRGGNLVLSGQQSLPGDRDLTSTSRSFLASFGESGHERVRYLERERFVDYQNDYVFDETAAMVDFCWVFDVGPDGRVYALPERNTYAIHVFDSDGTLERVIERAFTPRARTDEERRRMQALTDRRFRTFPFDLTVRLAETEPDVHWAHRGLTVLDDGTIWVRHSRSGLAQSEGVLLTFDVFDAEGHFIEQVALAGEGDGLHDGFFPVGGDRFVQVCGFEDAMRTLYGGGRGGFEGEGEPGPIEIRYLAGRRR